MHLALREELEQLREDADAWLDGRGERPRELRAHCLAFCSALIRHHTGEDGGAFPALARQHPELRPVIEELEHDHQAVTEILRAVENLVADETALDPARVRVELEGLTALLESHFVYEEKRLVAALNALPAAAGGAVSLLGRPAV
ncbi:hemerythrin domain-containing protein [Streptomyces sp. NPDC096193]|uniref:hemerythrin domain-containing protein n=1 Tax=Streptomyces sp. NPDC096193 TaxID=3155821 RepID=UPI00331822E8